MHGVTTARLERCAYLNFLFQNLPAAETVEALEALLPWNARSSLPATRRCPFSPYAATLSRARTGMPECLQGNIDTVYRYGRPSSGGHSMVTQQRLLGGEAVTL